jgi:hypothetical protein
LSKVNRLVVAAQTAMLTACWTLKATAAHNTTAEPLNCVQDNTNPRCILTDDTDADNDLVVEGEGEVDGDRLGVPEMVTDTLGVGDGLGVTQEGVYGGSNA